jgi:hypothetical protein
MAAKRIDLDAENLASERFTKGFGAVVPQQGVAHNAERRYFIFNGGWSTAPDPPFDTGGLKIGNAAGADPARPGSK